MVSARFRLQRGATLIELLIALFVGIIVFLALYGLVDTSNKLTKQQTELADVQQSARIGVAELSRIIRQSRVGGLSFGNAVLPIANNGDLIENADKVSYSGLPMTDLSGASHSIRPGTDVIEVRGMLFGDKYVLDEGDAVCVGSCDAAAKITVTIPATASLGFANFPSDPASCQSTCPPSSCLPSLASKTKPFYFVVQNGENQQVTANGRTVLVPVYVAGRVAANTTACGWFTYKLGTGPGKCAGGSDIGKSCTLDSDCPGSTCRLPPPTFTFDMDPQDAGAKKLNATTTLPKSLAKSLGGGAVDVIRFFADDRGDTHPSLAEAIWDPSTQRWDVQTLIEEVEDFQVAYGIDGADDVHGNPHDGGVSPTAVDDGTANADEWVGNMAGEIADKLAISEPSAEHSGVDYFLDTSVPSAQPQANPALRSVWISLVVKSADPDLVFDGPGARGIKILDSDPAVVSLSKATGRPYRRRPISLAVSLRNNAFFNK